MTFEEILSIGGRPGLYRLVASSRGGVIVESLTDEKRFPVSQKAEVSALKDIAIYTTGEEVPLPEVFKKIYEKEDGGSAIDHKSTPPELKNYMEEILPAFDQERVYSSNLKKLFQWYNILQKEGLLEELLKEGSDEEE